jgi:hypothetical protein
MNVERSVGLREPRLSERDASGLGRVSTPATEPDRESTRDQCALPRRDHISSFDIPRRRLRREVLEHAPRRLDGSTRAVRDDRWRTLEVDRGRPPIQHLDFDPALLDEDVAVEADINPSAHSNNVARAIVLHAHRPRQHIPESRIAAGHDREEQSSTRKTLHHRGAQYRTTPSAPTHAGWLNAASSPFQMGGGSSVTTESSRPGRSTSGRWPWSSTFARRSSRRPAPGPAARWR